MGVLLMGNKNLILVFAVLILWFMIIRPLSRKEEDKEKEIKQDSGALTPTSSKQLTPEFETGLNRYYTI